MQSKGKHLDLRKKNVMGQACSMHGIIINAYKILVGRSQGKRPLGRPRHRWKDTIKVDLTETDCENVNGT
jgi:hypothetical protein